MEMMEIFLVLHPCNQCCEKFCSKMSSFYQK